jgi:hypothetical protein
MVDKISENLIYETRRKVIQKINTPQLILLFSKHEVIFPSSIRVLRMIVLSEVGFRFTDYRSF